ncbi:MAG: hypothetical protein ABJA80_17270 [bacterium]
MPQPAAASRTGIALDADDYMKANEQLEASADGVYVVGDVEGGAIASILQVAMMGDLPYTALRDAVFAHPTLAESLNNLFTKLSR